MVPSELFEEILAKPDLYIGVRSVLRSAIYMMGYTHAQSELEVLKEDDIYFGFQQWVEEKYDLQTSHGWWSLISFMCHDDAEAFETAKAYWEEYKQSLARKSGKSRKQAARAPRSRAKARKQ